MQSNIVKGIVAGFCATVVLTLIMVVKFAAGVIPQVNLAALMSGLLTAPVYVGWGVHFVIGTLIWGPLFAVLAPRIPGSPAIIKGVLFAMAAWVLMQLLVLPVAGMGLFGVAYGFGATVMTFALHAIYGEVLGLGLGVGEDLGGQALRVLAFLLDRSQELLGLGAQLLGFGQLVLDLLGLVVERAGGHAVHAELHQHADEDHAGHALPELRAAQQGSEGFHRPALRVADQGGFDLFGRRRLAGELLDDRSGGVRRARAHIGHGLVAGRLDGDIRGGQAFGQLGVLGGLTRSQFGGGPGLGLGRHLLGARPSLARLFGGGGGLGLRFLLELARRADVARGLVLTLVDRAPDLGGA